MIEFREIKRAKQRQQCPQPGSFAIENAELSWEDCREKFSKHLKKNKGFYFSHEPGKAVGIASFIDKIEDMLKVNPKTIYAKTNLAFALWMEPAPFWMSCKMRKQLFTIFIRVGMKYEPAQDNFQQALLDHPYVTHTKNAVYRFLFGFTKYLGTQDLDGVNKGWVKVFGRKSDDFIRDTLVRPRKIKTNIVGMGELWC